MDFFNQVTISIIINVATYLFTAFVVFLISANILIKPQVKISRKIARGASYSRERDGEYVYKFKIVNKSYFMSAHDFNFRLYVVKKVKYKHNSTYTEHNREVDFQFRRAGLNQLGTYVSNLRLFFIRRFRKDFVVQYAYRIVADNSIEKYFQEIREHDNKSNFEDQDVTKVVLRLVVSYTDALNKKQFVIQDFDLNDGKTIFTGEFYNDGSLDKTIPRDK